MSTVPRSGGTPTKHDETPAWFLAGLGAVLGLVGIGYAAMQPEPIVPWTIEFALGAIPPALLVYGGYWLTKHELPMDEQWRIIRFGAIGGIAIGALATTYMIHGILMGVTGSNLVVLVSASVGAGTIVGLAVAVAQTTPPRAESAATVSAVTHAGRRDAAADPTTLSADAQALAEAMSDPRRWTVIRALHTAERPVAIADLAARIAAREGSDESEVRVYLRHATLPALADAGWILFNSYKGTVSRGDDYDALVTAAEELRDALVV
ncbi:DUF7344 domain-containing protein [Haloferacaceae archaeon DSL9]